VLAHRELELVTLGAAKLQPSTWVRART